MPDEDKPPVPLFNAGDKVKIEVDVTSASTPAEGEKQHLTITLPNGAQISGYLGEYLTK